MACILKNVRLSKDERIDIVPYNDGVNGEINIYRSQAGSQHYFSVLEFFDDNTKEIAKRILFGYHKKFNGLTPRLYQKCIGSPFKGQFMTQNDFTTFVDDYELKNQSLLDKIFSAKGWLKLDIEYKISNFPTDFQYHDLNSIFDFGQYRGLTLKEVLDIDEHYLSHCIIRRPNFFIDDKDLQDIQSYKPAFSLTSQANEKRNGKEMYMQEISSELSYEDYEEDCYEALGGEDYEQFDGDWDTFYASNGRD